MVGGMAFAAPNVSVGFWGRTIFCVAGGTDQDAFDSIYQGWGPNWGTYDGGWQGAPGPRMGLAVGVSSDKLEWHMNFRIDGNQLTRLADCYGVAKFIPDLLTMQIGFRNADGLDNFRKTSPNVINDIHNENVGRMEGWGIWLIVAPKDSGFEAALQWRTDVPEGYGLYHNSGAFNSCAWYTDWELVDMIVNLNVAASYKVPDVIKITLGWVSLPDDNESGGSDNTYPGAYGPRNIFARFELLMVPDMTLWLDARYWGLEDELSNIKINLGFGYKMGDLNLMLGAAVGIMDEVGTTDSHITFDIEPNVEYDLGDITIGLGAGFAGNTLDDSNMRIRGYPYIRLDDFAFTTGIQIIYNTEEGTNTNPSSGDNYGNFEWYIPIMFTFSFW